MIKINVSRETIGRGDNMKHTIKPMKVILRKRTYHRHLTQREIDFCENIVSCKMNALEAYRAAGYKQERNCGAASRLLAQPHIQRHIKELREKYMIAFILDANERQKILADIATSTKASNKDKIKAVDTLNKMAGDYVTKTELTGKDGGSISFTWEK